MSYTVKLIRFFFKTEKESLGDNWFYNNENQGFDYSCFEKLVQAGWEGGIERLRKALNTIGFLRTVLMFILIRIENERGILIKIAKKNILALEFFWGLFLGY